MKKYKALYKGMYDDLKDSEISMETVHKCMWEEAHEALQE